MAVKGSTGCQPWVRWEGLEVWVCLVLYILLLKAQLLPSLSDCQQRWGEALATHPC